jgi:hypothetical protein
MTNATSPVVTMCETNAPHIITSAIDGETYNLFTNRIRWDLLPADVQDAFRLWPHGFLYWWDGKWHEVDDIRRADDGTYRVRPLPQPAPQATLGQQEQDA